MLSKEVSSTIFKSLVCIDLGLNPGHPGHWQTLKTIVKKVLIHHDGKPLCLDSFLGNGCTAK